MMIHLNIKTLKKIKSFKITQDQCIPTNSGDDPLCHVGNGLGDGVLRPSSPCIGQRKGEKQMVNRIRQTNFQQLGIKNTYFKLSSIFSCSTGRLFPTAPCPLRYFRIDINLFR